MVARGKRFLLALLLLTAVPALAKTGVPFNPLTDIHWEEIGFTIEGVCVCPRPPPLFVEPGLVVSYWEPFLLLDTSSVAFYSAMLGQSMGGSLLDELGGKNKSSDAVDVANESTFAQAHAFLLPLMVGLCARDDYGTWWSEFDPLWQSDELAALLTPEAALFANKAMVLACTADAVAANAGWPLDAMPWCLGSGGLAYPMTGHVDNDNIVQANATAAYRMLYKLNRIGLICDPAPECGCEYTPVWVKSHYKMNLARPSIRGVHPIGRATATWDAGANPPFMGELGPNDEFLWVVYRRQRCCTCCE